MTGVAGAIGALQEQGKYIDYFTDGTTITSYPGDPEIHAHIAEKDAPIPTHEGLIWAHSTGRPLYDTPSGDLEEGQYAIEPRGTIIAKYPAFQSSTSTPATASPSSTETTPSPSDDSSSEASFSAEVSPSPAPADISSSTSDSAQSDSPTE
jgi:hypothetical protein